MRHCQMKVSEARRCCANMKDGRIRFKNVEGSTQFLYVLKGELKEQSGFSLPLRM